MNNFIKKARTAKKQLVQNHQEQTDTQKGLSKVEGILTSAIQFKHERETGISYCYAFFQLEGLEQDIPVIFKLDDSEDYSPENLVKNKPDIPPKSKVLLEGKWAEPSNYSNRSSFTCWAYQISTPPSPPTIKSLREQISSLLTTSLEKQSEWKQRTDFLFRKRKDLEELDKLDKLPFEYLQAYLLIRQAHYANYQDNLLQHTADLDNAETYLTKLSQEIEEIAQHIRAYEAVSRRHANDLNSSISDLPKVNTDYQSKEFIPNEPKLSNEVITSQQLLKLLGKKIATGEIKSDGNRDYLYVANEHFQKLITVTIEGGQVRDRQSPNK